MKKMAFKKNYVLKTILFFFCSASALGQNTGISDVANTPVSSAVLDVYSTTKGFLVPRLTQAQKLAVPSPATGLLIYQTNGAAGFYYYDGTAWIPFATGNTGWLLDGNSVSATRTLGTITNYDFPIITNNTEKMRVTKEGRVGIGSIAFDPMNPELLLVDYGTTTSNSIATFKGSINNYLQINVQNTSSGTDASTDIVATADNGTDSTNFIDLGINSSNYTPSVDNFGGPNDGYLFTNSRHLLIGTQALNSDLAFLVGGGQISVNQAMRIDGVSKNIVIGRKDNSTAPVGNIVRGPNGSGTNINGGSLTLLGGSATGTGTGGNLNITGGATVSGTGGAVNINVNANNATNINTGSSNQNVTIGNSLNNTIFPKWTTPGGVYYNATAGGQLASASLLVWDNTNSRLGINTASPTQSLETMNGNIAISNNNNTAGKIIFQEPSASGTNFSSFRAKVQTADIAYTWPATQGKVGSTLSNDGTGNLSWGSNTDLQQKLANESVVNSTTLQDDNEFFYNVAPNQTYNVSGIIKASCNNSGLLKVCFVAPAGTTEFINVFINRASTDDVTNVTNPLAATQVAFNTISATTDIIMINGTITTGSTGGVFKLQWAQQNSNATATTFYANSYLKLTFVK